MTRTLAEKRAYQRGYARRGSKMWDQFRKILTIAKAYRERSKVAHDDRHCAGCSRWTRGHPTARWGKCAASFEYGAEARMWADTLPDETFKERPIITSEDFGCVNWTPVT